MPIFDMPLAELYGYQGRSPQPEDHFEYWERALKEVDSLGADYTLTPASFQVPGVVRCDHLYFTGVGGARIHAKLLRPEARPGKLPALLSFHGYALDSGEWSSKVAYAASGFVVAALDVRGQGGLSDDLNPVKGTTYRGQFVRGLSDPNPDKLFFRSVFLDAVELAHIIMSMPEVDENRVGAMGNSQGGGLALACSALEPKIRITSACCPFLCDFKRAWELKLETEPYSELRMYFRSFDLQHKNEKYIFNKLGYIDVQNLAGRIRSEVKMFVGLEDNLCPPSTQFAAFNKIVSKKSVEIYPDYGHEIMPTYYDKTFELMMSLKG